MKLMAGNTDFKKSLFCCYLPCKMYMVKGEDNIVEKGIKNGFPLYECSACRNTFDLANVIKLENNVTGVKGTIVYQSIFAIAIIFIFNLSAVWTSITSVWHAFVELVRLVVLTLQQLLQPKVEMLLLVIPLTFIIIAGRKLYRVNRLIRQYHDDRGAIPSDVQLQSLDTEFIEKRDLLAKKVT